MKPEYIVTLGCHQSLPGCSNARKAVNLWSVICETECGAACVALRKLFISLSSNENTLDHDGLSAICVRNIQLSTQEGISNIEHTRLPFGLVKQSVAACSVLTEICRFYSNCF